MTRWWWARRIMFGVGYVLFMYFLAYFYSGVGT